MRCYPVGQRRGRTGHVNVRATPVMRDDLRDGPGLRQQGVQHPDGGVVVTPLARIGDGVQPGAVGAQPWPVSGACSRTVKSVPIAEGLDVSYSGQPVACDAAASIDQLGARGERFGNVSTKTALTPVSTLP